MSCSDLILHSCIRSCFALATQCTNFTTCSYLSSEEHDNNAWPQDILPARTLFRKNQTSFLLNRTIQNRKMVGTKVFQTYLLPHTRTATPLLSYIKITKSPTNNKTVHKARTRDQHLQKLTRQHQISAQPGPQPPRVQGIPNPHLSSRMHKTNGNTRVQVAPTETKIEDGVRGWEPKKDA